MRGKEGAVRSLNKSWMNSLGGWLNVWCFHVF
uniref:Uncharacterized protein n=1 Tax=Rhizophora mucronata TaxID=61149 RepID=A0A2P2ITN9_RHIMU